MKLADVLLLSMTDLIINTIPHEHRTSDEVLSGSQIVLGRKLIAQVVKAGNNVASL